MEIKHKRVHDHYRTGVYLSLRTAIEEIDDQEGKGTCWHAVITAIASALPLAALALRAQYDPDTPEPEIVGGRRVLAEGGSVYHYEEQTVTRQSE